MKSEVSNSVFSGLPSLGPPPTLRARDRATPLRRADASRGPLRAFTLIELILVIVLLAVLAGAIIPRITGSDRRRAMLELAAVESLLCTAAERDAFSSESAALLFDASAGPGGAIAFAVRRGGDPSRNEPPQWVPDPLVPPVPLALLELRDASADGRPLDRRTWQVTFPQSEPRPAISILLATRSTGRSSLPGPAWQLDLPADAIAPMRTPLGQSGSPRLMPRLSRSIDLDAAGRGNQAW